MSPWRAKARAAQLSANHTVAFDGSYASLDAEVVADPALLPFRPPSGMTLEEFGIALERAKAHAEALSASYRQTITREKPPAKPGSKCYRRAVKRAQPSWDRYR